jgi:hypothetical protein
MKEIEVPKEFKKELQKFNLYCRATMDDRDINWDFYYDEEDGGLYDSWSNLRGIGYTGDISHYFDEILKDIEDEYNDILNTETDCDDCTGKANLTIKYSPVTSTFEIFTTIFTEHTQYTETNKTFEELSKEPRPWYFNDYERSYQKLNNDDFVQSIINENDGDTEFEMTFSGYGDSGSIEDGNYSASIENLGYEMLDLYAAGFENNEGGNGTIYFNLKDKKMNLEYNQNYEESFTGSSEEIRLV